MTGDEDDESDKHLEARDRSVDTRAYHFYKHCNDVTLTAFHVWGDKKNLMKYIIYVLFLYV